MRANSPGRDFWPFFPERSGEREDTLLFHWGKRRLVTLHKNGRRSFQKRHGFTPGQALGASGSAAGVRQADEDIA